MIAAIRASGADVVVFRWADVTTRLPGRRMILPRMRVLNVAVGEVAERHGAFLVDLCRTRNSTTRCCGARITCTWRRPGIAGWPRMS